jgi:DNA-binding IclR family transcriptional regulator
MAVQPSPAVRRAATILRILAADSGGLTLSEVARRAEIHRSSCQSILLALCAEDLSERDEHRSTYRLGPALRELGDDARRMKDPFQVVEREMLALRDRFQASAIAGMAADATVTIVRAVPVPHPFGTGVSSGYQVALRAPTGPIYVAWSSDSVVNAWFDASERHLSQRERRRLLGDLRSIRQRGWSASVRRVSSVNRVELPHEVTERELSGADLLSVLGISAPVWSKERQLLCSMALTGFDRVFDGSELRRTALVVASAASRASAQ